MRISQISTGGITCQDRAREPGHRKRSPPVLRGFARSMLCSCAVRANNQKRYVKCRACSSCRKVSFSHVVLTIQPGVYLHSTTAAGVHFARPAEIWGSPEYQANQLVIRSRDLRKNPSSREIVDFSIIDDAIEYAHDAAGTPYNYLFDLPTKVAGAIRSLLKKDQNALFCSELAAKILRKNHAWTLSPEQTWPAHFEHKRGNSWDDVTSLHADYAALYAKGKDPNCVDRSARYCFADDRTSFPDVRSLVQCEARKHRARPQF